MEVQIVTIRGVVLCFKQMEQTMKKWEEKQQVILSEVDGWKQKVEAIIL